MLNHTILPLSLLSALLVVSLAASSNAQEKTQEQTEASNPAVTARVTELIEARKDDDASVHYSAAFDLREIGPAAKDAVPAQSEALKDAEASVSSAAERAQQVEDESRRRMRNIGLGVSQ